mgnify:FL=1
MTARDLQVRLQQDLTELFKDRRYKTPDGKMEPVHVFRQNLPQRKSEEDEDPFPYIIVALDSGGVKDQMTAHKIAVVFRIGIYDDDLTNQGHASVLAIMETMQQHYEESNTLGPFAFNDDGDGFAWALVALLAEGVDRNKNLLHPKKED